VASAGPLKPLHAGGSATADGSSDVKNDVDTGGLIDSRPNSGRLEMNEMESLITVRTRSVIFDGRGWLQLNLRC